MDHVYTQNVPSLLCVRWKHGTLLLPIRAGCVACLPSHPSSHIAKQLDLRYFRYFPCMSPAKCIHSVSHDPIKTNEKKNSLSWRCMELNINIPTIQATSIYTMAMVKGWVIFSFCINILFKMGKLKANMRSMCGR